ncbi:MAG: Gfo/Idh/MocA family oxidoreductase [Candidatus Bathyarchaeia archaeon]
MDKLKVAVVGCGFVAQKRHIPGFLRLKRHVSLCAICDLNQNLAKGVANRFGIANVYTDLSEMLSKERPDVVDVCTPPKVHVSVAIEAMEKGCHVLLEKPMASDLSDCDKMIQASRKHGVKLSVVHNQRFYPPFIKAEELVKNGAIGELTGMRVISLTPKGEYLIHENHWIHKLPGGIIGETGPHVIYMSLAFVKNVKNVEVTARKKSEYPWVLYDDYRIEIEGEKITSSIIVSHINNYTASKVELFGTEYALEIDLQSMLLTRYKRSDLKMWSVASSSLSVSWQIAKGIASNAIKTVLGRPMLGHDIMIEKYVKSIINDLPVPVTPEEGRETVKILEMIVRKMEA